MSTFDGERGRYTPDGGEVRTGGQAQVVACRDASGRRVAVKWLVVDRDVPEALQRERFERERARLAELGERSDTAAWVVPLLDHGERDGRPFLVLPWLEHDLSTWAASRPSLVDRLRAAQELCDCLQRLHGCRVADAPDGLVHRDVKSKNALVDADDALAAFGLTRPGKAAPVLLSDLGGVREAGRGRSRSLQLTEQYAAPEVLLGRWSKRADVFAVAVSVVEVLLGARPRVCDRPLRFTDEGERAVMELRSDGSAATWARSAPLGDLVDLSRREPLDDAERAALVRVVSEAWEAAGGEASRGGRLGRPRSTPTPARARRTRRCCATG